MKQVAHTSSDSDLVTELVLGLEEVLVDELKIATLAIDVRLNALDIVELGRGDLKIIKVESAKAGTEVGAPIINVGGDAVVEAVVCSYVLEDGE